MTSTDDNLSLLGELGAQRVVRRFLTRALRNVLSVVPEISRKVVHEQLLQKLREQQGELMYGAPSELTPSQQAQINVAFQVAYRELVAETKELLESESPNGNREESDK
jgi:hypothetical protein